MTRTLFGTDGIRGQANVYPMTIDITMRLAMAAALYFRRGSHRHTVVIGKDTRLSGYMLEPALAAGFTAMGMDVIMTGPLPTPAIARLVPSMRADLGVMISASHNPYQDNGLKLFGPDGYKLSDDAELAIEQLMQEDLSQHLPAANALGRAQRLDDGLGRYIENVKATFPKGLRLDGLKIVVDCAHGAAYKAAPTVLWELGAEVIPMGVQPNGVNINEHCGATHPKAIQKMVLATRADFGIALDGDADRVMLVDEGGHILDGDQILGLIATFWKQQGLLANIGIVATVMSNLGLETYLQSLGLHLHRTKVGDRYVVEAMRQHGYNVGGEQSGHIVLGDHSTTGDGLTAALQVLAVLVQQQKPASAVARIFEPIPQVLRNVVCQNAKDVLRHPDVQQAIATTESNLKGKGRVLVRPSGTEPLLRIMVECADPQLVDTTIQQLENVVSSINTVVA